MDSRAEPEFSFPVNLAAMDASGESVRFDLTANVGERAALALRFGCVEISKFEASAIIKPLRKKGHYSVGGTISARVVQNCVVSMEPVATDLDREFRIVLIPEAEESAAAKEFAEEEFEPYSGNMADLGELAAVELALALDPYPRASEISIADLGPGGDCLGSDAFEEGRRTPNRPFEALAELKKKSD